MSAARLDIALLPLGDGRARMTLARLRHMHNTPSLLLGLDFIVCSPDEAEVIAARLIEWATAERELGPPAARKPRSFCRWRNNRKRRSAASSVDKQSK